MLRPEALETSHLCWWVGIQITQQNLDQVSAESLDRVCVVFAPFIFYRMARKRSFQTCICISQPYIPVLHSLVTPYFTALYPCISQPCIPVFHSPVSLYFTILYPCISQPCIPVFHSPVFHSPVSMYFTALYLSGQCRPAHRWLACVHAEDGAGWVHEWWQSAAYGGK